jgi:hypothetical protein
MPRFPLIAVAVVAALLSTAFVAKSQLQALAQPVPTGCNTWNTPFCNAAMVPIPWTGHVFQLSQDYPKSAGPEHGPWLAVDPHKDPGRYATTVLAYFYEGNIHGGSIENDFDPRTDHVRRWYNAPFQDLGTFGREFVHGLTEERNSAPGELTHEQSCPNDPPPKTKCIWTNYAVGFYNAPGGVVLHNVWSPWRARAGSQPDIVAGATVPEGTVAAKLLFTSASPDQVPFIKDAPAWKSYIYNNLHGYPTAATDPRSIQPVRLLQIDFAVKDRRGGTSGWVFGTFVYGGGPGYSGPALGKGWRNVAPVGVMWGNDPGYDPASQKALTQTWLNPAVKMLHYGYQGRLNGPVDNPASSCMSCHSTGEIAAPTVPGSGMFAPSTPPTMAPVAKWFRNIGPSEAFDGPTFISTGFSLQVMDGLRNYYTYYGATPPPTTALRAARFRKAEQHTDRIPPRDGGTTH